MLAATAVLSLIIGRPYVGYLLASIDPKYAHWREDPPLKRAMAVATVLWGFIFLARALVQGALYLSHRAGWLAAVKIGMGWPLFAAGLAATYWLARRASPSTEAPAPEAVAGPEPAPEADPTPRPGGRRP